MAYHPETDEYDVAGGRVAGEVYRNAPHEVSELAAAYTSTCETYRRQSGIGIGDVSDPRGVLEE